VVLSRAAQAQLQERAAERSRRAIRAAFLLSIERIRGRISRREIAALLEVGNTYGVVRLVDAALAAEPFRPLETALHEALIGAGKLLGDELATTIVRKRAPWGFRAFEPATVAAAQIWIGGVTRYLQNTVRAAVVRVILGGDALARTPGQTARAVLESIGLTEQQVRGAEALRAGLERQATTDAAEAARQGARLPRRTRAQAEAALERYRNRALRMRASVIGDAESRRAASIAAQRVYEQAADDGLIDAALTRKRWQNMGDHRVRAAHNAIPLMNPEGVPLDRAFASPLGPIRYPYDERAPLNNVVGCRCWLTYSIARAA
jgi:hypothetical protein